MRGSRRYQRAAESEIDRLERALQVAATANQTKSRYLANVSHEIRAPLNVIYGYAQLIERGGATAQEAARVIRRCTEHLTRLVEGLLDMSQVENGVLRLRIEPVALGAFMNNLVSMMRPAAEAKGLELHYDPPARMPTFVTMDQSRLQQVLINLLSNAIKFTDHGTITVRLRYASQIATFDVIDTGPGIASGDRDRIFEAFQRGEDAELSSHPGVGLGLTISQAIIAILGGQLSLATDHCPETNNSGACFRIKIMLGEAINHIAKPPTLEGVISPSGFKSVLIIDDDPDQLALLERHLVSLGLSVVALRTGAAALDQGAARHFDLAILDVSLGDMSGWDVAAQLRTLCREDLKIMMLTANAHELHRLDMTEASHDLFLLKPFDFDVLTRSVATLLRLGLAGAAPQPAASTTMTPVLLSKAALLHVMRLRELLRIGHVRGIDAEIKQLAASAPHATGLIDQLFGCLDKFDLAGLQIALEPY